MQCIFLGEPKTTIHGLSYLFFFIIHIELSSYSGTSSRNTERSIITIRNNKNQIVALKNVIMFRSLSLDNNRKNAVPNIDNFRSREMYRFQFSSHPKCTLHEDFGRLLQNRLFCDIEFLVGQEGIVVPAHMAFVAARSAFLREKILRAKVIFLLCFVTRLDIGTKP